MLHIITPLFRYDNIHRIYSSLPDSDDIIWHIAKTNKREKLDHDFLNADWRINICEIDCQDNDLISKRNFVFNQVRSGHFHLLDDDTLFHPSMYDTYVKYKEFEGMVIGKQLFKDGKIRLNESYPEHGQIDAGNVLCHNSILRKVKWSERPGFERLCCRDFIFWDNCFKLLGVDKTILIPEPISIYNALK